MGIQNYSSHSFDAYVTVPLCENTVEWWHKLNFTPNGVTLIHIILKVIALYMLTLKEIPVVKIASLIAVIAYLDALDGIMARKYDQGTKIGMYLDGLSDLVFWIIFAIILIIRLKGVIRILFIIVLLIAVICIIARTIKNGGGFEEDKTEPTGEDYIWSTVSWNIVPLAFLIGIPLMSNINANA